MPVGRGGGIPFGFEVAGPVGSGLGPVFVPVAGGGGGGDGHDGAEEDGAVLHDDEENAIGICER